MTSKQVTLVQNSWRLLRDLDREMVGELFYSKLFLDHPEIRVMFPKNMIQQYQQLIEKFNIVISRLHNFEDLKNDLCALAIRHIHYGVRAAHYSYVGSALLWTLKQGLGNDWTPPVANAWADCYKLLSITMIEATETIST